MAIWLCLKKVVPKWHPGKWNPGDIKFEYLGSFWVPILVHLLQVMDSNMMVADGFIGEAVYRGLPMQTDFRGERRGRMQRAGSMFRGQTRSGKGPKPVPVSF